MKRYDVREVLTLLSSGFIKAGKSSSAVEMVRGASNINREIRVGITHVRIAAAAVLPSLTDYILTPC